MTRAIEPTWSERMYAMLLLALPAESRRSFGAEMRELFRDRLYEERAQRGRTGVCRLWARALPDLLVTAAHEHVDAVRARRQSRAVAHLSFSTHDASQMTNALVQDTRFALRILRKNPAFTVVAIAVIALGIGAVSTIFSVANAVVLHDIPGVADPSRVVTIERTHGDGHGSLSASYSYYEQLAARSHTMSGMVAWDLVNLTVSTGGEGTASLGNLVSGNYFDVLGVRPALGRFFAGDEGRVRDRYPVVVLSHEFWQRRFAGDSTIIGRDVLVNERRFTVIGVAPARFSGVFPVLRTDVWLPLMMQQAVRRGGDLLSKPGSAWLELFGRLAPGASRDAASAELTALTRQIASNPQSGEPHDMAAFTGARVVRASGLPSEVTNAVVGFFVVLLVVSGLVLLIASVNVASMLLARAVARRREIAVRVALGAGRVRMVRQMLTESVLLFAAGGAGGILLAVYGTRLISRIELPVDVPFALDLAPDARVLVVTLLVALLTGVVFGLAPALQAARTDVITNLRGDSAGSGRSRSRLRTALVVCQVAASLLLLTTSALFIRALDRGRRVDIGFDPSHVEIAGFDVRTSGYDDARARQFYAAYRDRLAAIPGVSAVAYARILPLSANTTGMDIVVPGYSPPRNNGREGITVLMDAVDEGYFAALRTPIVRGRGFERRDDEHARRVAVVNEAFVRTYWPGKDAVGRSIRIDSSTIAIVGVVRDSRFHQIGELPAPFLFLPVAQEWRSDMNLLVRTSGDPASLAPAIRRALHDLDPNIPIPAMSTLQQSVEVGLLPQRVAVMVTGALGIAGLVLAAIGLYGVVSFSTAQRTREIGVRVALGAARRDVLHLVVGEGMRLVGAGVAVGLVLAVGATQALKPFLFGVNPLDAIAFVGMAATLLAATLLASYLPARRAANVDPVTALRQE